MNKKDTLLIFDIDGVLVDVTGSYRMAAKLTAELFTGKEITLKGIQELKNKGGFANDWNLTEAVISKNGLNVKKNKIIDKFQELYNKLKKNEKWLMDMELLAGLSKSYLLTIFTARPKQEAIEVLKKFNALDYFDEVIVMEDIREEKPNPEGLLKIIKKFNINKAYYFGDTVDDVKAAVNANIVAIGVLPPSDKSEKLKNLLLEKGAKIVISDINQIKGALK